jgi:hypothetical protein
MMQIRTIALLCGVFLATIVSPTFAAEAPQCCFVKEIDAGTKIITLSRSDETPIAANASGNPFWAHRNLWGDPKIGDQVTAIFDKKDKKKLVSLTVTGRAVSWRYRATTLIVAFLFLILLAAIVTRWKPREFLIGADRRYSNSKTQLALWFLTVMSAYLATVYLRVEVGDGTLLGFVDIPTNLLAVSGLSALTYGGAKAITTQKVDTIVSKGSASPKTAAVAPNILTDLFQNDVGEADLGDFQMILITLLAIAVFLFSMMNFLALIVLKSPVTLPDIDTTLLSGFGIGQGAYLVKKMASKPGEG